MKPHDYLLLVAVILMIAVIGALSGFWGVLFELCRCEFIHAAGKGM